MTEVGTESAGTGAARSRSRELPQVRGFARRQAEGSPKEEGKALRRQVPRSAHASFDSGADGSRPDAETAVRSPTGAVSPG